VYSNGFRKELSSQRPFIENNKHRLLNKINNFLSLAVLDVSPTKPRGFLFASNVTISQAPHRGFSGTSNLSKTTSISPWGLTGFVDAEGCFRISLIKNINYKEKGGKALPLKARLYFQIGLHRKDETILKLIQSQLGVGNIYRSRSDSSELQVSSLRDMPAIINHFDMYPLITKK
jgi:hypothetical protein